MPFYLGALRRGVATDFWVEGTNYRQVANLPPKYSKNRKRHRIWATSSSNLEGTSPPKFVTGGDASLPPPPPLPTPMALRMLNVATGYSNNTLSCSELNRKHTGEGFWSLRHILTPLWTCESNKCDFFAKIWPLTWPNEVKCWRRTKNNM